LANALRTVSITPLHITMKKLDPEVALEVLREELNDAKLADELLKKIQAACEQEAGAEEKEPRQKNQFVVLLSDPEGILPTYAEFAAWVLQIPECESVHSTRERIDAAAHAFNATKKGRLLPVKTVGEAMENVPTKHFKEAQVSVKTKTPVLVVKTDNRIMEVAE
jgi:hypothetical protein